MIIILSISNYFHKLVDSLYTDWYAKFYKKYWRCKVEEFQELDNREKILECALDLFYQKGYDAVGVQEIVTLAGITKPTLYYYFKSKYGLLEALLRERCCKMNEQFAIIRGIFEQAAGYLGNMNERQEQFAVGFSGILSNYILVYFEREDTMGRLEDDKIIYSLVHQFMHGIVV